MPARACSSGSTRTWPARPWRSRRWRGKFFGRGLERWVEPGFAHRTRWRSAAALQRLFSARARRRRPAGWTSSRGCCLAAPSFARWSFLAQDQYLEVRTLLSGYLLSSQGDRMLMAHSVEGRFPFLDAGRRRARRLAARRRTSCVGSTRSTSSSGWRAGWFPRRSSGARSSPTAPPTRSPSSAATRRAWVAEVVERAPVAEAGIFDPRAVGALWRKCRAPAAGEQFSNADNMALVGVLSTGPARSSSSSGRPPDGVRRH